VHRLARGVLDRAPEPPPCPGPPVDPHHPACLSVTDALLDQPDEALLLIHCPTAGTTTPTLFQGLLHRNLHSRSELRRSLESAPSTRGQIRLTQPDVGALVAYLRSVPWYLPDFTMARYREQLYALHEQGEIRWRTGRFWLAARRPSAE